MWSTRSAPVFLLIGVVTFLDMHYRAQTLAAQEAKQTSRTWSDSSGAFHINAVFVQFKNGKVQLQQHDGKILNIPIEYLSDVDWDFVRHQVQRIPTNGFTVEPTVEPTTEKGLVFHEDFSKFEKDDLSDWGNGVHVDVGQDGRKWLVASEKGRHPVGRKVDFPQDSWYLEFDFTAQVREEANIWAKGFVTTSISLIDEQGKPYRIAWQVYARKHTFVLPDGTTEESGLGTTVPEPGKTKKDAEYWMKGRKLRLEKNGDALKLFVDGKQALSGEIKDFSRFVRFEVDAYNHDHYGGKEFICFTNFKVGSL